MTDRSKAALGIDESKFVPKFLLNYCIENGWTDLLQIGFEWWGLPPGAVVPIPAPSVADWIDARLKAMYLR